jgi:hypothetical protein
LCIVEVDWLAACIAALRAVDAVLVVFLWRWRKIFENSPANGKQGPIPEEMFQTLLTS